MSNEKEYRKDGGLWRFFTKGYWTEKKTGKKKKEMEEKKNEQKNLVLAYQDQVNEAYGHTLFVHDDNPPQPIRKYKETLDAEFNKLLKGVEDMETDEDFEYVRDRAIELLNNKAFLYPEKELEAEARAKYEEILSWRVQPEQREPIKHSLGVIGDSKASEGEKRAHLLKVYESYDELDEYVDWMYENMVKTGALLLSAIILGLGLSLVFLTIAKWMIPGVLMAGASGAAMSILMRLPPSPIQPGAIRMFYVKALSRFATGILATVIGYSFLAANILTINANLGDNIQSVSDLLKNWDWSKATVFNVFLLISICVILGFTERLFSRLAGSIFPEKEPAKKEPGA
jgi:hypothetical protein